MPDTIKLGVSSCLLGNNVRYDSGHQLDRWIHDELGRFVEFVPVCPEVESGLPIPREAMRLVGDPDNPRLVGRRSGEDFTERVRGFSREVLPRLADEDLCGFIFKAKSPSSGMERVKVYTEQGMPDPKGVGIFAREFMDRFPLLPVEDDGRLHDPRLRENFIERVFVMKRWRDYLESGSGLGGLVDFHTNHKLLLLSHSQKHYREMGKLVAAGKEYPLEDLVDNYQRLLMEALSIKANPKSHFNTLEHVAGHFKDDLTPDERQELREILQQYKDRHVPLIVPATLINHYVRKYGKEYLARQVYLHPHPVELHLRNHV
ncbi:YbgA family protein [Desulfohalovibrio reitneri]|uniref:YbgA family protein n=1 Tax=Desulfohalovibrio reitneri TaxID=1307759 RepID=UPI0004A73702|nr:DUF523 and DUF1722 domain-containing protein [Desulfohalovibrio reitneri]